jgi:site-specific recombinase XerD
LSDIDTKFAVKLKAYCLDKKELNNTISKRFQLIRVVLKWCEEMKYISDVNFNHFSHPQTDKIEAIILNEFEIQKIANVDLKGKPNLESIRDLFLIACNTGVDFIDLPQINKQNLHTTAKGNMYFQIKRSKTSEQNLYSNPPCNKLVFDILEKRNWTFDFISYDKSLQHLKTVCELAKLNEVINLSSNSGKKKITYTKKKYEWIAWKTARRSFITNLMSDGKQTELVSSAVGHTKPSTTAKYQHLKPALMVDLLAGD